MTGEAIERWRHDCTVWVLCAGDRASQPVTITFVTDSTRPRWRIAQMAMELAQRRWRANNFLGEPVGARHNHSRAVVVAAPVE